MAAKKKDINMADMEEKIKKDPKYRDFLCLLGERPGMLRLFQMSCEYPEFTEFLLDLCKKLDSGVPWDDLKNSVREFFEQNSEKFPWPPKRISKVNPN